MKIDYSGKNPRYFDNNDKEILVGDVVKLNGKERCVYITENGYLGTDATNPTWLANGKAVPCEYGIYPFEPDDDVVLVRRNANEV